MKRHNMARGVFFVAVALAAMRASAGRATRTFCTVGPVCGRGLAIIFR